MRSKPLLDLGNEKTWPTQMSRIAAEVLDSLQGRDWKVYPADIFGTSEFESPERALLQVVGEHRIVGYHCTRLLPHEISSIRDTHGLEVLTEALRRRKVRQAVAIHPDLFPDGVGGALLESGPNAWQGSSDVRLGEICLAAPFRVFEEQPDDLVNLFLAWGGETLGWLDGCTPDVAEVSSALTHLSTPAIVEVAADGSESTALGSVLCAVVSKLGGATGSYGSEWRTRCSVPPEGVLDVILPGSDRWPPAYTDIE